MTTFNLMDKVTHPKDKHQLSTTMVYRIVSVCRYTETGPVTYRLQDKWGNTMRGDFIAGDLVLHEPETFKSWAVKEHGGWVPNPMHPAEDQIAMLADFLIEYVDHRIQHKLGD